MHTRGGPRCGEGGLCAPERVTCEAKSQAEIMEPAGGLPRSVSRAAILRAGGGAHVLGAPAACRGERAASARHQRRRPRRRGSAGYTRAFARARPCRGVGAPCCFGAQPNSARPLAQPMSPEAPAGKRAGRARLIRRRRARRRRGTRRGGARRAGCCLQAPGRQSVESFTELLIHSQRACTTS